MKGKMGFRLATVLVTLALLFTWAGLACAADPGQAARPAPSLEQSIQTYQATLDGLRAMRDGYVEKLVSLTLRMQNYEAVIGQLQDSIKRDQAKARAEREKASKAKGKAK